MVKYSINWEKAIKINLTLGKSTLNPRQGLDLMLDLRAGASGKKKIYDIKGKEIDSSRLSIIHDEIWEVRDPWRAEYLDAKFSGTGKATHIVYGHELDSNGNLYALTNEPLEDCLMQDCYADVKGANRQGLLIKESKKKELYFWYPRVNFVAWFDAYSDGAFLICDRNPAYSNPSLGVRPCREKK